jgi:hypothetical protein
LATLKQSYLSKIPPKTHTIVHTHTNSFTNYIHIFPLVTIGYKQTQLSTLGLKNISIPYPFNNTTKPTKHSETQSWHKKNKHPSYNLHRRFSNRKNVKPPTPYQHSNSQKLHYKSQNKRAETDLHDYLLLLICFFTHLTKSAYPNLTDIPYRKLNNTLKSNKQSNTNMNSEIIPLSRVHDIHVYLPTYNHQNIQFFRTDLCHN